MGFNAALALSFDMANNQWPSATPSVHAHQFNPADQLLWHWYYYLKTKGFDVKSCPADVAL